MNRRTGGLVWSACFFAACSLKSSTPANDGGVYVDAGAEPDAAAEPDAGACDGGFCVFDGGCVANNTDNPANQCQSCKADVSQTSWTNKADGTSCDDGLTCTTVETCHSGVCTADATQTCSDGLSCTTDSCIEPSGCSYALEAGNCLIAGVCYANLADNPANQCQWCRPDIASTTWTNKGEGSACNDGLTCSLTETCQAGTCTAVTMRDCNDALACTTDSCVEPGGCSNVIQAGFCVIATTCYSSGTTNPGNACEECNPALSTSAWSAKACPDAGADAGADAGSWARISAGDNHTCAVKGDGTLWCWGWNSNGRLGDGTTTQRKTPTQIGVGTNWASIAAAYYHTCGTKTDGTLWCWGANTYGQLGDGTSVEKWMPTHVDAGADWSSVGATYYGACGMKTNRTLWCWGRNQYGEIGDGTDAGKATPTYVDAGAIWASFGVAINFTCGTKTDGTLWCWGRNQYGQHGDGTTSTKTVPTFIDAGTTWTDVTTGYAHTCGLRSDGTLWCWGYNDFGQVGDGTTTTPPLRTPIQVGADTNWASVRAGYYHTCGTKDGGILWCWGADGNGQLGDGTTTPNRPTPTYISSTGEWADITGGDLHTCGVKGDGTIWCWGYNGYGQIGDGTTTVKTSPTQIGN